MADETTVDELNIEITASARRAAKELGSLYSALNSVYNVSKRVNSSLAATSKVIDSLHQATAKSTAVANQTTAAMSKQTAAVAAVSAATKKNTASTVVQTQSFRSMWQNATTLSQRIGAVKTKIHAMNQEREGVLGLGNSFIQMRSVLFTIMFLATTVGAGFAYLIKKAMDSTESMNRFAVLAKSNASAANEWADNLSNVLGLDPVALKNTYATFYGMADAMDMSAKNADILSKNFTQLTYDIASVQNSNFDEVFTRLRSALSGETEAIDIYGYNIKQTNLQLEMLNEGIKGNVAALSASDKAILIHNLIMRTSIGTQGDFARTMASPANMTRILADQLTIAARSIGYLFIPMLQAVVPYLIVFVQWINQAAVSLLNLFGVDVPNWSTYMSQLSNSTSGVGTSIDNATDSAGGLSDALKEIKNNTLGFDELHILDQPSPSAAAGAAGGTAGGGASGIQPIDVYDMIGGAKGLDSLTATVKAKLAEMGEAIAPFKKAWEDVVAIFAPFAQLVWTGFTGFYTDTLLPLTGWTMDTAGVWILERLKDFMQFCIDHPEVPKFIGEFIAALVAFKVLDFVLGAVKGISKLFGWFLKFKNIEGIFGTIGKVLSKVWKVLGVVIGAIATFLGIPAWAVGLIIAAIAVLVYFIIKYWDEIKAFFIALWAGLVEGWTNLWNGIKDFFVQVWTDLVAWFSDKWNDLVTGWQEGWENFKTNWTQGWQNVADSFKELWEGIKKFWGDLWNNIVTGVGDFVGKIWDKVTDVFGKIKDFVKGIWNSLGDGLGNVWETIKGVFKDGINGLIWLLNNGVIAGINVLLGFANKIPGLDAVLPSSIEIPYLARGGMPETGSAFIAGENGAELIGSYGGNNNTVMPLENSGFVQAVANAVYSAVSAGVQNMPDAGDIVLELDGVKIGKGIRKAEKASGVSTGLVSY